MLVELLEQVRLIIEQVITGLGYPGIGLVMFAENVFPPIPSELVMPLAGFLVADGKLSLVGVLLAGTLGAVAGALVLYVIASGKSDFELGGFAANGFGEHSPGGYSLSALEEHMSASNAGVAC